MPMAVRLARSPVGPSKWEKGIESKGAQARDQQKAFDASVKYLPGESSNAEDFKTQRGAPQQQNPGDSLQQPPAEVQLKSK